MYDADTGQYSRWTPNATAVQKEFWVTYGELLYVSTAVMTTAGYGDAFPTSTMARFCTCLHMMCSVFYVTVIMSVGLSKRSQLSTSLQMVQMVHEQTTAAPGSSPFDRTVTPWSRHNDAIEALHTDASLRDRALSVLQEKACEGELTRARGKSLGKPVATLTVPGWQA